MSESDTRAKKQPSDQELLHNETSWTYDQLLENLRRTVIHGETTPFVELPTGTIDFGEIAVRTQELAVLQAEDQLKAERGSLLAMHFDPPNTAIHSSVTIGNEESLSDMRLSQFFPQGITTPIAPVFLEHSHLLGVFGPTDIFTLRKSSYNEPGLSVGVAETLQSPGFTLYALRSAETDVFIPDDVMKENSRKVLNNLLAIEMINYGFTLTDQYPEQQRILKQFLIRGVSPTTWSQDEVMQFSTAQDTILRGEAERHKIALYLAPWGSTVARRCDLKQPVLSQLPTRKA